MKWLTNWLIIRGCNLLYPHAFYYSIRGPRIDERPPDVGPNSPWWDEYRPFADSARRLCWLNTDSKHICELAILGLNNHLPWQAAKVCFQNQRDFNYLETRHLWEDAEVDQNGIRIAGMHYRALIVEIEPPEKSKPALELLDKGGRLIRWSDETEDSDLLRQIERSVPVDVRVMPASLDVRVRHIFKNGVDYYIVFNEGENKLEVGLETSVKGKRLLLDPQTSRQQILKPEAPLLLKPHELRVLMVISK
jgi:hypothetical protein